MKEVVHTVFVVELHEICYFRRLKSFLNLKVKVKVAIMFDSLRPHQPYSPQTSPGQNTGLCSCSHLQRNLSNPGIKPRSPALQADFLPAESPGKPKYQRKCKSKLITPHWQINKTFSRKSTGKTICLESL